MYNRRFVFTLEGAHVGLNLKWLYSCLPAVSLAPLGSNEASLEGRHSVYVQNSFRSVV